jgi:hypothetical protein
MVCKMRDSVPNLSANEVRGARPSLLALGKQKHARCKPDATRPEINSAALRRWFGHDQRTLLAPFGIEGAEAGAGAMLVACRLAGLSALVAYYAGVDTAAQMLSRTAARASGRAPWPHHGGG